MESEKLTEQDYIKLQQKINEIKMQELFEEPSTYEDEEIE